MSEKEILKKETLKKETLINVPREKILIRTATPEDAEALLDIYAPYVNKTAITFEYEVPTVEEFRNRIENTLTRYPYIVIEDNGIIQGYAYTSPFGERIAYKWSVETSIYIREDSRKSGYGRMLYDEIERISIRQNAQNMNACIACPGLKDNCEKDFDSALLDGNIDSIKEMSERFGDSKIDMSSVIFHERIGYKVAGHFHKCGSKFGKWYDMVWMEKIIGGHEEPPMNFVPFPDINI